MEYYILPFSNSNTSKVMNPTVCRSNTCWTTNRKRNGFLASFEGGCEKYDVLWQVLYIRKHTVLPDEGQKYRPVSFKKRKCRCQNSLAGFKAG